MSTFAKFVEEGGIPSDWVDSRKGPRRFARRGAQKPRKKPDNDGCREELLMLVRDRKLLTQCEHEHWMFVNQAWCAFCYVVQ